MIRHLPPAATPITAADISHGLRHAPKATDRFEIALEEYFGGGPCRLAASGRAALFLLLQTLRESAGAERDEVLLPAYTCPVLVKVIQDAQLRPVPVDISPRAFTFDLHQFNAKLSRKTLAVIGVHPFGMPQDFEVIQTMAKSVGATLIEDAVQSMGAKLGGRHIGTRGDFGLFGMGPGKPLSTGGGGVLCVNNAAYTQKLNAAWQTLPQPAAASSGKALLRYAVFTAAFHPLGWGLATRLGLHRMGNQESSWGYVLRPLTEAQAAIGLTLLERLDAINQQRRENAQQLVAGLQGLDFVHIPPPAANSKPIYLRLPIIISDVKRREALFERLWKARIGVGKLYERSLPQIFPQMGKQVYSGADKVASHLLTLPTHHYLTEKDIEKIVEIFERR